MRDRHKRVGPSYDLEKKGVTNEEHYWEGHYEMRCECSGTEPCNEIIEVPTHLTELIRLGTFTMPNRWGNYSDEDIAIFERVKGYIVIAKSCPNRKEEEESPHRVGYPQEHYTGCVVICVDYHVSDDRA
jgi:hypothetical protein